MRRKRSVATALLGAAFLLTACGPLRRVRWFADDPLDGPTELAPVDAATRRRYLRAAELWLDSDVEAKDLRAGPARGDALVPDAEPRCAFFEPAGTAPPGGRTPKFFCQLAPGDLVMVKYGAHNTEIYGEMLGSRLLWALGAGTDDWYAVRLTCDGCPEDPWRAYRSAPCRDRSPRATRRFDAAIIERSFRGRIIEECRDVQGGRCTRTRHDEGWSWQELDRARRGEAAARRAEHHALVLLKAFIQHGDDKPANQRLTCLPGGITPDGRCARPFALMADLGATFGRGAGNGLRVIDARARPNLAGWRRVPLWDDVDQCRARLSSRTVASDPVVSEAGRAFLAARMARLGERQIRELFVAARVVEAGERIDGRAVTVDDWVRAFLDKRAQLAQARCPR